VNRDESQGSVGGLFSLDQYLDNLGHVDQFWDFGGLVKSGAQGEAEIAGSRPLLREFLGLGFM
jgi:hypothetical protein